MRSQEHEGWNTLGGKMFQKIYSDTKLKTATHFPAGGLQCQEEGTNKTWGVGGTLSDSPAFHSLGK